MPKSTNLTDLVSLRTLEKLQDNFSEATGIACVVRNIKGEPITKISNPSGLWQEVHKHPEVEKDVDEKLQKILEKSMRTGQIEIWQRYFDTYTFIVPMHVEGQVTSFFIGGLTRFGNPDIELCIQEAKRLNIDIDKFLELYLSLPLVTKERLMACANLLKVVSSTIGTLASEGTQAKQKAVEMEELNDYLEKEIEKNEKALFEREERYRLLFETMNDGIYMADANGIIKDMNITGAKLLKYEREELIGTNMKDLYVHPQDRDEFLKQLYREGHREHFYPFIRLKDGTQKYFESNSTIITNKSGKIIGVQGIFRDLDPRTHSNVKKLEQNHAQKAALTKHTDHQSTPQQA